jgi:adenosylcobinamide-GDP ribazoletransferase
MNKGRARFLSVFTLMSRVPVRSVFEPDYSRSDFWLPAISPLVSLAAGAGGALGALAFGEPFAAAIAAIAAQYLCFNLFHLDGLLDTADAMATVAKPARRLEILKDSRIGSYAFFFGWLALAAKAATLAILFRAGIFASAAALLAAPLAGRLSCALVPLVSPPAKPTGLGSLMRGFSVRRIILGFCAGALPLAALALAAVFAGGGPDSMHASAARLLLICGAALIAAAAGGLCAGLGLASLYRRRVGGFTGDALGAAVEAGEILALALLAAVLPRII